MLTLCFFFILSILTNGFIFQHDKPPCCSQLNEIACREESDHCQWQIFSCIPLTDDPCKEFEPLTCPSILSPDFTDMTPLSVRSELAAHTTKQWPTKPQKEIINVTDGVYSITGYDLANMLITETSAGLVIIDVLSEGTSSFEALMEFKRKRLLEGVSKDKLKLAALIFTHNHVDHSFGLGGVLNTIENGDKFPKIYTNKQTFEQWKRLIVYSSSIIGKRSKRQFGNLMKWYIPEDIVKKNNLFLNSGIGPYLRTEHNSSLVDFDKITFLENKIENIIVGDTQFDVYHAPGETSDQSIIHVSSKKVVFCGDNFYQTFPNLYTIRGTPPRDPKNWAESVKLMRDLKPDYLVGSHTRPISPYDKINKILTTYHDAIRFVHDQTVRHMNARLETDDIIDKIYDVIPDKFRQNELYEFYGSVDWSVRSAVDLYVGWFDGEASSLYPASRKTRGEEYLKLFSLLLNDNEYNTLDKVIIYLDKLTNELIQSYIDCNKKLTCKKSIPDIAQKKERWILELVTYLTRTFNKDTKNCQQYAKLMKIRWKLIKAYAGRSISANGRNYLTTVWLEEQYGLTLEDSQGEIAESIPANWFLDLLQLRMAPEKKIINKIMNNKSLLIIFNDLDMQYRLTIRDGILDIDNYPTLTTDNKLLSDLHKQAFIVMNLTESEWRQFDLLNPEYIDKPSDKIQAKIHVSLFFLCFELPTKESDGNFLNTLLNLLLKSGYEDDQQLEQDDIPKKEEGQLLDAKYSGIFKDNGKVLHNNINENKIVDWNGLVNRIIQDWWIIIIGSVLLSIMWCSLFILFVVDKKQYKYSIPSTDENELTIA